MFTTRFYLTLIFSLVLTAKNCAMHDHLEGDGTMLEFNGDIKCFIRTKTLSDWLEKQRVFSGRPDVQVYALPEDIKSSRVPLCDARGNTQFVRVCKATDDIYVRFKSGISEPVQTAVLNIFNLRVNEIINVRGLSYAKTSCNSAGTDSVRLAAELQEQSEIAFAEPDFRGASGS